MAGRGRQILLRYAQALHELARQGGAVESVTATLDGLHETVAHNEELRIHLASPQLGHESKKRLVLGVLGRGQTGDGADDLVRRTVGLLVDRGRASLVGELGPVFREVADEAAGRLSAKVRSAAPLDEGQRSRLVQQLGALTGKTISLEESVDPGLLGGVSIILGSQMIDGSVRRRLQSLQGSLMRAPVGAAS